MKGPLLRKWHGIPAALLLILVFVGLVSAVVYWTGTQTLKQTIKEVVTGGIGTATITLDNIYEATPNTYDNEDCGEFEKALTVNVSNLEGENLSVKFDNASDIEKLYYIYQLKVIADTVPSGSGITAGDTVLTVDLSTTTDNVGLDVEGEWIFDYEVAVMAKRVTNDITANAKFTFEVK